MSTTPRRSRFVASSVAWLLVLLLAGALARLSALPARANSFVVPNGNVAALIQAINDANASSGPDIIDLANNGAYTLTAAYVNLNGATGLPALQGAITINGHGAKIERSATAPAFRILAIGAGAAVQLNDLTIAGGKLTSDGSANAGAGDSSSGGGIANDGTLTLNNTIVRDNVARAGDGASSKPSGGVALGGGIYSTGALILNTSTIRNNSATAGNGIAGGAGGLAFGGGIYSTNSSVQLHNSTIGGNHAGGGANSAGNGGDAVGGGLYTFLSDALIDGSTISGNSAAGGTTTAGSTGSGNGGGIYMHGNLTLQNSTISGNSGGGDFSFGGGIFNESGDTTASSVTIGANSVGGTNGRGGGYSQNGTNATFTFKNTILARNTAAVGPDCYKLGTFTSGGYNLVEDHSDCFFTAATGDQLGLNPLLGTLQNNGGSTQTQALLAGSPAIDGGNPAGCKNAQGTTLATDQRGAGFFRSRDGNGDKIARCDIGAYELQSDAAPTATPTVTGTPPTSTPTPGTPITPTGTPGGSRYKIFLSLLVRR